MSLFLLIGVIGLVVLTVSLISGDLLDGVFDAISAEWFSGAVIGGFVSAFGFGAAIADGADAPRVASIAIGVGAGVLFAWFASWLTRVVRRGETDGTPSNDDIIGHDATVVTGIPADGYGVVTVRLGGHVLRYNAQAETAIQPGTQVYVSAVLSPTAVAVTPLWTPLDES